MGSASGSPPKPWIETPCIYSAPLSREAGCNVYLKLENLQPSGSFKSRGVGNRMLRAITALSPYQDVHFYTSSGGNAGLACAVAATTLQRPATVVVPHSTLPHMVAKLRDCGAEVLQVGANWAAADKHLREVVIPAFEKEADGGAAKRKAVYVAPFDHPDVWDGAETMVAEVEAQLELAGGRKVDGILCSVGGGGLLCGIMQGVQKLKEKKGYGRPKVIAVETQGGHSLNASVLAGEVVTLPAITTIATSLGATRVADEAFAWTQRSGGELISTLVTDEESVVAMERFLDDSRMLVESACSATIATIYNGDMRKHLGKDLSAREWAEKNIVVVVCGGSNISLDMLVKYKEKFGL